MGVFLDLTGQVFGRLTVIHRVVGAKPSQWWVKCLCGVEKPIYSNNLRRGGANSCGCLRTELLIARNRSNMLPFESVAKRDALCHYIVNARSRKLEWGISNEYFYSLIQAPCYWCGDPPANVSKITGRSEVFLYSGIDRVDNLLGYVEGNVVSCCFPCNQLKRTATATEFVTRVTRIAHNLETKGYRI